MGGEKRARAGEKGNRIYADGATRFHKGEKEAYGLKNKATRFHEGATRFHKSAEEYGLDEQWLKTMLLARRSQKTNMPNTLKKVPPVIEGT